MNRCTDWDAETSQSNERLEPLFQEQKHASTVESRAPCSTAVRVQQVRTWQNKPSREPVAQRSDHLSCDDPHSQQSRRDTAGPLPSCSPRLISRTGID